MKEERSFEVQDSSGDRKYFTLVPNHILNHSTATAQALYLQLKRLAGEDGIAYPSAEYLLSRLHISRNTLRKEMKYLLERGWIARSRDVRVKFGDGVQTMKSYRIVDIWKLNVEEYTGGQNSTGRRGSKEIGTGGQNSTPNKNIREKEQRDSSPSAPALPFSLKEEIGKLKASPQKHIQLIGEYLEEIGFDAKTMKAFVVGWKRHLPDATKLAAFEDSQIGRASDYATKKYKDVGWNMGTLVKIITSNTYAK